MKSVVVGTAGHIDHGKSSLVRALTGTDPDRLKEEQARGITIDLGFAHLETGGVNLAFVDVPGHERFVRNMLAGAGGIDLVMLCVAADESVMPQTREHFQICRLLQVPAGLVVLTRADLADADMRELAAMEVRELVRGSFLEPAPIVAVSARTGQGLDELRETLAGLSARLEPRRAAGAARLPVDRVFTVKGFGTVATGTLVSGRIREEAELDLLPSGARVKVRGLEVHGRREAAAAAGQRVAVNLGGIERAEAGRGDTLCAPGTLVPTRRLDVAIELLPDGGPLRHGVRVRFHQGTTEVLGRVAVAGVRGGGSPAGEVEAGGAAWGRIRLERPVVVTRGDRFILRTYSPAVTTGGGVVLDPQPPRAALRTPGALERFRRLDAPAGRTGTIGAVGAFLDERGAAGLPVDALVSRAGLDPDAAREAAAQMVEEGRAARIGDLLVPPAVLQQLGERLLAAVTAHHAGSPLAGGLPREEARERIFHGAADAVFDHVVAALAARGAVEGRERLAIPGRQVTLSPEEARVREAIEEAFRRAGLAPPDLATAGGAAGGAPAVVERVAALLVRQKRLVRLEGLLFHVEPLERLKAEVVERARTGEGGRRVDVAAFKARYGISRKYAIPLLEYLDRERVTRRVGDARIVIG